MQRSVSHIYLFVLCLSLFIIVSLISPIQSTAKESVKKMLVAHRGASAYAPEHTLEAYRLAIEQGADYVEQDLQVTRDGVLVCLHDLTLERTTNVEDVFPDRFRNDVSEDQPSGSRPAKHWYVSDFTLGEIKKLDAGSWFSEKFRGAKVPTWQEAIDLVRGKAGLYPETKAPEVYLKRGLDMEKLLIENLNKNKLDLPSAEPKTPVIIQSFSPESLRKMRFELKTTLPLVLLIHADPQNKWLSVEGMKRVREFANGIGPAKGLVEREPMIVKLAHDAGLTVTPYTFRSSSTGRFKDVREEMNYFLYKLGVDALFTDNPDQFPRQ
ncbi:MAG: glycerophosphodiester phosphodiesterase [Acidobacteria bacterium]|nr:glycerophosphodiester phosphodiesterase [Acidobacteriota bacterium]MCI0666082.1 glycerophosphodiester phosphodiesterase [Acidobacteriota bacterium]